MRNGDASPVQTAMRLWSEPIQTRHGRADERRSAAALGAGPEPVALGPQRRLRAIGDADLAEDPREEGLDRLLGDVEPARDELVRQPLEQQPEDLALARRQLLERVGLGARRE